MKYVTGHQDPSNRTKMWSAKVIMTLVTIIRKTGIQPSNHYNSIQVMLFYLCLEKDLCKYVVNEMDESFRLVCICMSNNVPVASYTE